MIFCSKAMGLTLSGTVVASTVTVTGDVSVSSMTVSSITASSFNVHKTHLKGTVLQTIYSSTTVASNTTSTTLVPIPNMSATIALSNPLNYVRISLSGMLQASFDGTNRIPHVNLSIERDSTDLGQGGLVMTSSINGTSTGLTIIDSPGDTSAHTYQATFDNGGGTTEIASFTASPVGYLLLEEVAQ